MAILPENIGDHLEQYTYEYLLSIGLATVPDSIDKRQGSIIWDAIAPAAYTIAEVVQLLRQQYKDTFVLTAEGDYLDLKVAEIGLTRYPATFALKKGFFYDNNGALMDIPIGSRFRARNNTNNLIYEVTSIAVDSTNAHETGIFALQCETEGRVGNQYSGDLVPISTISGLARAVLGETLVSARDRETDDELRQRYIDRMNEKPFGGNVAQYKQWLEDYEGIGQAQIYPIWNGGGTVKLSIIDNDFMPVSDEFIAQVQHDFDPQDILPDPLIRYYSGNPANFTSGANRFASVRVIGRAIQSGTGTPSETNVRAISGVRQNPNIYINSTTFGFNTSGPMYAIPVPGGQQIADFVEKTNGEDLAVETRNTKLVTLTGTETGWAVQTIGTSYRFILPTADAKPTEDTVNTLSSHFPALTSDESASGDRGVSIFDSVSAGPSIALVFPAGTGVNSLATFRTWMSSKNVQVLYQIQTPTYANQSGIEDVTNPSGSIVATADDDASLLIGVISQYDSSQLGLGIAPIGHKVTVVTADEFDIDVTATVVVSSGYTPEMVESAAASAIERYFDQTRSQWGRATDLNTYDVVIYQSQVVVQILSVPGIISVTTCLLNGVSADIILTENSSEQQLPILGTVTLS